MPVFCGSMFKTHYQSAHLVINRHPFIERRPSFWLHFKAFHIVVFRYYAGKSLVEPVTR